jgi:hypothetical protein
LPGVVEFLVGDALVGSVVAYLGVAELRDVDGRAGAADLAFVIVVDDSRAAEYEGLLLGRENNTAPGFRFLLLTAFAAGPVISAGLSRSHVRPDHIFTRLGCRVHGL